MFTKKSILNISDCDYSSNQTEYVEKKPQRNSFVCSFLRGIWFHTQSKDGENISSFGRFKANVTVTMMLQQQKSNGSITWWWHYDIAFFGIVAWLLHICTISILNLLALIMYYEHQ